MQPPATASAATIIDTNNLGKHIYDRPRPLAESTHEKIRRGQEKIPNDRFIMTFNRNASYRTLNLPLHTITTVERLSLVTPTDEGVYLRMLTQQELAAGMAFPKDYAFSGNKAENVRMIGNAVCANVARDLVQAVYNHITNNSQ